MGDQQLHIYSWQGEDETIFIESQNGVFLSQLLGRYCGICARDEGPERIRGLFALVVGGEGIEWQRFLLKESSFSESAARVLWAVDGVPLELETTWKLDTQSGVWSRQDVLRNTGSGSVTIDRCLSRFSFTPGTYEVYSQASRWCHENQGAWVGLEHGGLVYRSEGGRTSQGTTPFICLRGADDRGGVAFHLVPQGNWVIQVNACALGNDSLPGLVLEMGLSDDNLRYALLPGETLELPEIWLYHLDGSEPHQGIDRFHQHLLGDLDQTRKPFAPVVYNTWFDDFDFLDLGRLRQQLKAAQETGCEVFVIDAGWYGGGPGNWSDQVGDWREKLNGAFYGKMADFAGEVRAAGLGFGLWLEPERIGLAAPILRERPEWLIRSDSAHHYPDLCNPEVYQYIRGVFEAILTKYQPRWIKVDFNFELARDPHQQGLSGYFRALYRLMDEVRAAHPEVFFEGCSSGAMRQDIQTYRHFDGNFLSDTVNPNDCLRIYQGAILRGLPGRISRWVVLRSVGSKIPQYGTPLGEAPDAVVTPTGATWEFSVTTDPDFALRAAMMGMLGFSGDIAGLPAQTLQRLRAQIEYYKTWRLFIADSKAWMLTPPQRLENRQGWIAIQFQQIGQTTSLLFVFRLEDISQRYPIRLEGLDPDTDYNVIDRDGQNGLDTPLSGRRLMDVGIAVVLKNRNRACILEIVPERLEPASTTLTGME